MQIFVAHDFTNPPLRRYRRPFQQLSDKYGVDFKFADDIHAAEHLLEQIENLIATSDYSLFDVSTWNRNVFLELGFAGGRLKRNALLFRPVSGMLWHLGLRQGYPDVPADIKGLRQLRYSSEHSLKYQLDDLIQELMPSSDLSRTQHMLTARIEDLVGRYEGGLTSRQISDLLNLDREMTSASVRKLVNAGRLVPSGHGPHKRYRKAATKEPMGAAE